MKNKYDKKIGMRKIIITILKALIARIVLVEDTLYLAIEN